MTERELARGAADALQMLGLGAACRVIEESGERMTLIGSLGAVWLLIGGDR